MNDTFNMSRLGYLIDRHYAMYRRHYLTALLIPAVLPWLLVGFMPVSYTHLTQPTTERV